MAEQSSHRLPYRYGAADARTRGIAHIAGRYFLFWAYLTRLRRAAYLAAPSVLVPRTGEQANAPGCSRIRGRLDGLCTGTILLSGIDPRETQKQGRPRP